MQAPSLKRSLSLPVVVFYGIGTMIGAGIYAVIGKIAGIAGIFTPWAFLVAALIAFFTCISYAELSSYYPRSGGVAIYIYEAWHNKKLANFLGLLLILTGIVSSAAMANAFAGYFQVFIHLPAWIIIVALLFLLGGLAIIGINESVLLIMLVTLLEIGGLVFIIFSQRHHLSFISFQQLVPDLDGAKWISIASAAFLAFYAYIGFEDMVNLAEEIKNPTRNLPIAILLALLICTLLYFTIALVSVLAVSPAALANSNAPFALLLAESGTYSPKIISVISLIAVTNGIIVQIIMSARVLYGMGKELGAPQFLAYVNSKTKTPIISTIIITFIIIIFSLWLPILTLAKLTSAIILFIFAAVNIALIKIKLGATEKKNGMQYPLVFPFIGAILCVILLLIELLIN